MRTLWVMDWNSLRTKLVAPKTYGLSWIMGYEGYGLRGIRLYITERGAVVVKGHQPNSSREASKEGRSESALGMLKFSLVRFFEVSARMVNLNRMSGRAEAEPQTKLAEPQG